MSVQPEWIHWMKFIPEMNALKGLKIKSTNAVDVSNGSFSYQLKMDLRFFDGPAVVNKAKLAKNNPGFYELYLNWEVSCINEEEDLPVEELKLLNCSIKISMASSDRKENFSKWVHLDVSDDENKTGSWKTFIPKAKFRQLVLDKEKKIQNVLCNVVVFARLYVKVATSQLVVNVDQMVFGPIVKINTPLMLKSWDYDEGSKVALAIKDNPEENVEANKFLLAAYSPVLRKMLFETDMKEKATGVVQLSDTSIVAVKTLIEIIDGKSCIVEMSTNKILDVLALAHRYQVQGALDMCTMNLMAQAGCEIEMEAAYNLFRAGKLYEIPELCDKSFEWFLRSSANPIQMEAIYEFVKENTTKDFLSEYSYFMMIHIHGD